MNKLDKLYEIINKRTKGKRSCEGQTVFIQELGMVIAAHRSKEDALFDATMGTLADSIAGLIHEIDVSPIKTFRMELLINQLKDKL